MANFTPQEIEQFLQEFFDTVGARQYIGARYIPIFGRAGSDTVEWDDLAPYEPLTVVMHDGVSYVSRRYVPAGIEITDTNYWVQTYRFNAQVEQYRQQVLAMQDDVDNRVPFPNPIYYPKLGELGQVLSTLADGTTKWQDPVVPSDEQAEEVISQWLEDHPEATTTVQDGAITTAKLANGAVTAGKAAEREIFRSPYTAYVEPESLVTLDNAPFNTSFTFRRQHVVDGVTYTMAGLPTGFTYTYGTVITIPGRLTAGTNGSIQFVFGYGDTDNRLWYRTFWANLWSDWNAILINNVNTANIVNGAVTTDKIANGAVTPEKVDQLRIFKSNYTSYVEPETLVTVDDAPLNTSLTFRREHVVDNVTYTMGGLPTGIEFTFGTLITITGRASTSQIGASQFMTLYGGDYTNTLWFRQKWANGWQDWVQIGIASNTGTFDFANTINVQSNKALGNVNGKSVLLVGDSITFGTGSTGALRYTMTIGGTEYSINGNGPNTEGVTTHTEGPLLSESSTRKDYEALDGNGWAQQLVAYLANLNCTCRNFGINGMNAVNVVPLLTSWWPEFGPFDYVIVCVGTNDRNGSNFTSLATNYQAIVNKIRELGAIPIMIANIPCAASNESSHDHHMYEVRETLRNICLANNVTFIDLYTGFLDYCWVTETTSVMALSDSLHPNDTGYRIMFNILTGLLGVGRTPNINGWM